MSIGSTRISNVSVVNVADEEKQESCTSDMTSMKDECVSLPKTTVTTSTITSMMMKMYLQQA